MVNVIDNSGAAIAECVKVLKMKRHARIGAITSGLRSSSSLTSPLLRQATESSS